MKKNRSAILDIKVFCNFVTIVHIKRAIPNDLPTDHLGEAVSIAVQRACNQGFNPINFSVVINFE